MDKSALLPEIAKIKIKHPRAADFKAKISRAEDCFAVSYDPKAEDCLRCVLKVEYEGKEMSMCDVCKLLMNKPLVVTEKKKGAVEQTVEEVTDKAAHEIAAAEDEELLANAAASVGDDRETGNGAENEVSLDIEVENNSQEDSMAEKKKSGKKAPAKAKPAKVAKEKKEKVEGEKTFGKRDVIILDLLKKKEMSQGELVEKMGIRGSTTNIALRKLMDMGAIQRKEEGRGFIYFLTK